MGGLKDILLQQREQTANRVSFLTAKRDEQRSSWIETVSQLEAAKADLDRIDLMLNTLETAATKAAHQPTIMQAVLDVLKVRPEGMTALEILDEINSRYFEGKIVRTSLSPQLSRLKDRDRKITLRGNRWYLLPEQPSLFTQRR
jgi:hypothetical protein